MSEDFGDWRQPSEDPTNIYDQEYSVQTEEEAIGEDSTPIPVADNPHQDLSTRLAWVKKRIRLPGYLPTMWTEEHEKLLTEFVSQDTTRRLIMCVDNTPALRVALTLTPEITGHIMYFVKTLHKPNVPQFIQYGTININVVESLYNALNGFYVPMLLENKHWPDSVKRDFLGQLHRFMASLTEMSFQAKGVTVLYIPSEDLENIEMAAKDKDLTNRLDAAVIHWTRQIKEVVSHQDTAQWSENAGPLAEIQFWRSRTLDLSGIREQLEDAGIKRIRQVLELAKSTYLNSFVKHASLIEQGSEEAQDNLQFLSTLQEPCEKLANAKPKEIPAILPNVLTAIKRIWETSKFYNTPERLTSLLRKVSNEIINRCCATISLPEIFEGDVEASIVSLQESINSGDQWKALYLKTVESMAKNARPWSFETSNIFAQVDAFVQRCRDLLEVCEGQVQFSRKNRAKEAFPVFGGSRGPEITKSIYDIEISFSKLIQNLKGVGYNILDVKATKWHDDFNSFKHGVKDLEVMMQNVINSAFECVATVAAGVELVGTFDFLAKREAIRRTVDKKAIDVYDMFIRDLTLVKDEFEHRRRNPPVYSSHPKLAGSALWAKSLLDRITNQMRALEGAKGFLVPVDLVADANLKFSQQSTTLEEYINKIYNEWLQSVPPTISKRLEVPLMTRNSETGLLENNFDLQLLKLFGEIFWWQRMGKEIPYSALELYSQKEKLRVLRENVQLVVRDYNSILRAIVSDERKLFSERVKSLDQKILPGLGKLTWASQGVVELFVKECRRHAGDINKTVVDFKDSSAQIARNCKIIGESMLVKIKKKRMYKGTEFEKKQEEYRMVMQAKLLKAHQEIQDIMNKTYEVFRDDSPQVQAEWEIYVEKVDSQVEEALRQSIRISLHEISRAVGDGKSEVIPFLQVNVVLEMQKVDYKPTFEELVQMVNRVAKELIASISVIPRLSELKKKPEPNGVVLEVPKGTPASNGVPNGPTPNGTAPHAAPNGTAPNGTAPNGTAAPDAAVVPNGKHVDEKPATPAPDTHDKNVFDVNKRPSFYELIAKDEDTLKIFSNIVNSMTANAERLQKYLSIWDNKKYKHIWELDKDAYIRRYAKTARTVNNFETEIARYLEVQQLIEKEETITNISFIRIDSGPLKYTLSSHCSAWVNKFTGLLNSTAAQELKAIHDLLNDTTMRLRDPPQNIDMLKASIDLVKKTQEDIPKIEGRFEPMQAQYKALEKFEVTVSLEEQGQLETLQSTWNTLKQTIVDTDQMIKNKKERFKADLMKSTKEFSTVVEGFREDFMAKGPFTTQLSVEDAKASIAEFRKQYANVRDRETRLVNGLSIFNMETPANVSKDLALTVKDLDLLEKVWSLTDEWNKTWERWKGILFNQLNTQVLEEDAMKFQKRVMKLGRDIKHLDVWVNLKDRIDQVKAILPLIVDMKNPALRPRHWSQLQEEVGKPFDPNSDDFTLDSLTVLGFDAFAETIGQLSLSATKELAIEESLHAIEEQWNNLNMELVPHKDGGHYRLKTCDEIFQALEDNQVTLSTMKSSRFFFAFESQVEYWEKTLSHILETTEMMLQVQRQWRYLENIFAGSEDIRRQLPAESNVFDKVNANWKMIMERFVQDPNCLRGTQQAGLLDMLIDMNGKLEKIQKSLDQYLETKRMFFPRFYFLSNDDLLEILGQSKEPLAVQKHLKKCFDNIKSLEFTIPKDTKHKKYEALGMHSSEGEYIAFPTPVIVDGPVEVWLTSVETAMIATLRKELIQSLISFKKNKKDKWVKDTPGQMIITGSQILWTQDCSNALEAITNGEKNAMRELRRKQAATLKRLSDLVRSQLTPLQRLKLVALITIEVHNRDVIERLIKANCTNEKDFEWKSQLRFYWEKEEEECFVRQTNSTFHYGYEYLGNSGRLVITPLTDKCYLTLTTALSLKRGGCPQGPAGTGKTETVKDLGKALAKYVIVFNCSEGLDYKSLGRTFSGLAQTGAWGCFDEFNRIEVEVLSVVASQISSILNAISEAKRRFVFEGTEVKLNPSCGIFVTMNPGYAGRSELPDNLKSLFRPCSMMVPDYAQIAEIMLFSEGFSTAKFLSKKIVTLFQLATQQLSKQDHYDFTLRSIKSVLVAAGALKRADPEMAEDLVLIRALRDMNVPKLVGEDLQLFMGIMSDLFPGSEFPETSYGTLQVAIEAELTEAGLQLHQGLIKKIIQLYETKLTRHGTMVVGKTGSGKSTCWKILQKAMSRLKKEGAANFNAVRTYVLNPKAISMDELYGGYDQNTREWTDGILSSLMRTVSADEKPDEKWIIFDGPVDTLWIESMNSVLDDNRVLTLINSERIAMPHQVSMLFEVEDLAEASPATVSRCGMIYLDIEMIGWRPVVESWLNAKKNKETIEILRRLLDKYIQQSLNFRHANCKEIVPTTDLNSVMSFTRLFDAVATVENGVNPQDADFFSRMIELWFLFSLIWSIGATVDENSRKKFDMFLREIEGQFPRKHTVFEYYVDPTKRGWALWEDKIAAQWRYPPDMPFYKILVPTVDTVRNSFIVQALVKANKHVLLIGNTGTGKTSTVQGILANPPEGFSSLTINFSAQTSSNRVQEIIEGNVEKRTKDVYVPQGGKKMIVFVDDLNMPSKDQFGSQPPLELLRQWIDYGFWYDREKQTANYIKDMQLVCAMGPPGGGRNVISARLLSRFNVINVTFPSETQIDRIFGTLINQKLQDFDEELKPLGDLMTQATREIYTQVTTRLLPTPTKSHYVFNLRDMSKVFQGLLKAQKEIFDTAESLVKLWQHECMRVFHDRLIDTEDRNWFKTLLVETITAVFSNQASKLQHRNLLTPPMFGDFLNPDEPVYEELSDWEAVKKSISASLEEYNVEPGYMAMDLVLFKDALEHVCRIHRILRQPRGNALLVGIGGSGRKSLARLAAFMAGFNVFTIEIRKNFRQYEFREKLKELYFATGVEGKHTVFLFTDTQIIAESFLEDVTNILSSGEVPNLYTSEELGQIREALRNELKNKDTDGGGARLDNEQLHQKFIERARNHMHVVLCMSPVGDSFRRRCRMFPALVNCTTIDWFSEWPHDALKEVALKYLGDIELGSLTSVIADTCVTMHQLGLQISEKMRLELKREYCVTPANYLELVTGFIQLLQEKRKQLGDAAGKLDSGLVKLDDTKKKVEEMSVQLEETKKMAAKLQRECEEYLVVIVQQRQEANDQAKQISAKSEKIEAEENEVKQEASLAQSSLDEALPALEGAKKALESLNKKDLAEVKTYTTPPPLVEKVMEAVMILRKADPTWLEAKRQLNDPNFLMQLIQYNIETVTDAMLKKIDGYVADPDFKPEKIGKVSAASMSLCIWVIAIDKYAHIHREVAPKQAKLKEVRESLEIKTALLSDAKEKLRKINEKVAELKSHHKELVAKKDQLKKESDETQIKLTRAEKLVSGLASERVRWEQSIANYKTATDNLPGDCLLAAGFLSYSGPFTSEYRNELMSAGPRSWSATVKAAQIPCSPDFNVSGFLVKQVDVRDWNIQGLPNDTFSTENGALVTKGRKWPLMIDPQGQANKWIKNMERNSGLKIITLKQSDYLRTLENAIHFGTPVLLQDVLEELDASLEPILNKAVIKIGARSVIRLEEGKEIEYNPDFRFYITTKLSNPTYPPEITTKTTLVNFAVKEQGLEAQLLGIVVRHERKELEEQRESLVLKMSEGQKTLLELEDKILYLLNTAQGSLLDDEQLVDVLQSSKATAEEIKKQLLISEQTSVKIDLARQAFSPCSVRASTLFFVLKDLALVDPMYQFSLESYVDLFKLSLANSPKSDDLQERIKILNDYHTLSVYNNTCRGLFEKHKLLFSFQMCVKIMESEKRINREEFQFFLRGGQVLKKESQMPNPCSDWLPEFAWDNLTVLDHLPNFRNIASSFEQNVRDWKEWYFRPEAENMPLPGEWENKCNELQHMILVRCLRPDRILSAVSSFIGNNLDHKYIDPPVFNLGVTFEVSSPMVPLIFVLSPGVDPRNMLQQLAVQRGMTERFRTLALGQGQETIANRYLEEGIRDGNWVFFANCHLMISWMHQLEKLVETLHTKNPHPDFRLWLSSAPHPDFPIALLQRGIKITTEPPRGIKANLARLYNLVSEHQFNKSKQPQKYKKLVFSLSFFHAILLERRKFMSLGWNVPYDFNDSDYQVSENLLSTYLDEYEDTPWDALKYLISEINYGGRVTDKWDIRLLNVYIRQFINAEALGQQYRLSSLTSYYIPDDGSLQSYKDYVATLPILDKPEVFGHHSNADIASQIIDSNTLLDTLLSMQPRIVSGTGESRESKVLAIINDIQKRIPENIDPHEPLKIKAQDPINPLNTVLLQEIARYNSLLNSIRRGLAELQKGIKGLVVMSNELDEIFSYLYDGKVPPAWQKAYPSLKPLGSWTYDLIMRIDQFRTWAEGNVPNVFWLGGFTFPTGFLTAILQKSARANGISVDAITWDFVVLKETNPSEITAPPKEGVYVSGLFLEGAGWDPHKGTLAEPAPMQLEYQMPIIHFKPVEAKKKVSRSDRETYLCPCYIYPIRTGTRERPSFMLSVDLDAGNEKPDYWTKRGTALLLSNSK